MIEPTNERTGFEYTNLRYKIGEGNDNVRKNFEALRQKYDSEIKAIFDIGFAISKVWDDEDMCFVDTNVNLIIAGGMLRSVFDSSEIVNDIDVFIVGDEGYRLGTISHVEERLRGKHGYYVTFRCPEGKLTTYESKNGVKIQLIHERAYPSIEELLNTFDIRACCIAYDGLNHRLVSVDGAIGDIRSKTIAIHNVEYPVATLLRIHRYMNKGYHLPDSAIQNYLLSSYNIMEDFMTRIDIDTTQEGWMDEFWRTNGRRYID